MRDESLTDVISRLEKEIVELSSIQPYVVDAMALKLSENVGWDINSNLSSMTEHNYEVTFTYSEYLNSYAQLFVNLDDFTNWRIVITDLFYQSINDDKRKWNIMFMNIGPLATPPLKAHFKVVSAATGSIGVVSI